MNMQREINFGIRVPQMPLIEAAWQEYFVRRAHNHFCNLVTPIECRLYDCHDLKVVADYRAALREGKTPVWRLPSRGFLRFSIEDTIPLPCGVSVAGRPTKPTAAGITYQ